MDLDEWRAADETMPPDEFMARWESVPPAQKAYYHWVEGDENRMEFALRLTKEHGVAAIPTSAFLYKADAPPVLRFCFAKKDETLETAADRLRRL